MTKNQDMTQGPVYKQVLLFFLPIVAGSFFQHFYSIVDAIVVGRGLGYLEFAAVTGSASKLVVMITNFFLGVSVGITVYASRAYGEKNFHKLKSIVGNGLVLFVVMGVIISALGILFADQYLAVMQTPENTLVYAKSYMNTYLVGIVFCVIYNTLAGILRALGDAKGPLYILALCSVLNIVLDVLFALVFRWGVMGVALATVIAQAVSALVLAKILKKALQNTGAYRFTISKPVIKEVATMGIPSGIQSMMFSFSNMAVQSAVNSFSTVSVAGWGAYLKIDSIADVFLSSLATTITPFVGQNLGAGKIERLKEAVNKIVAISFGVMAVVIAVFLLFRTQLLTLFTTETDVIEAGTSVMCVILPMYLLAIPDRMYATAIRGLGKSFGPMWLTLIGVIGLRFLWVYLVLPHFSSILVLAMCYPVSSILMSVAFTIYYRKEVKQLKSQDSPIQGQLCTL